MTDTSHAARRTYWDAAAASKTFTHPLDIALLSAHLPPDATVLDYGCGQGRLCAQLQAANQAPPPASRAQPPRATGTTRLIGVDLAPAMIERARAAVPEARFEVLGPGGLTLADASVDAVLLFAVLTCIPDDAEQVTTVGDITRVLRPGGLLYLSDYALQADARNVERYARHVAAGHPRGVFLTDDGARVRHHEAAWLDTLLSGYDLLHEREVEIRTMNGHGSIALQRLLRRSG
jgi:SAM-dependent methyltransferase